MNCLLPYKFSLAQLHGTLVAVKQVRISAADGVDMSEVKALRLLVISVIIATNYIIHYVTANFSLDNS